MGESRDANDPRDAMRSMRKEAQAEFEREEASASGGQEHASREEREGLPASRRHVGQGEEAATRSTREQSRSEPPKARGDPVTGSEPPPGEPREG